MERLSVRGFDGALELYYNGAGQPKLATNGGIGRRLTRSELAAIADWADDALRNYPR